MQLQIDKLELKEELDAKSKMLRATHMDIQEKDTIIQKQSQEITELRQKDTESKNAVEGNTIQYPCLHGWIVQCMHLVCLSQYFVSVNSKFCICI